MFHVEFLTMSMVVDTGYLQTFGMELLGSRHCTRVGSTSRSGGARGKLSVSIWTVDIAIAIETNNRFGMSHVDSRVCLFNILPKRRLELIVTCTKIVRLHEERCRMNMNQNGRSRRGSSKWSKMHRNTGFETFEILKTH